MRWSIRAKLTALVVAVLLPLLAGAVFKFWQEQRDSRERAQERLLLTAQVVARQFDGARGQMQTLEALAAIIDDVTSDQRVMAVDWAVRNDLLVLGGVPVEAGDDLVGVLTLNLKRGRVLDEDDRALLVSFASQAAVAIHNARLFAGAQARRHAAETLADVGRALAQALDPDVVGPRIADSIRALLDAQSSGLYPPRAPPGHQRRLAQRSAPVPDARDAGAAR